MSLDCLLSSQRYHQGQIYKKKKTIERSIIYVDLNVRNKDISNKNPE